VTSPAFTFEGPLLVRSPNWLGDAVMVLPAVRNLKTALGPGHLVVAAPEKLAALWEACPFVDKVVPLPQPKKLWTVARVLREGKYASAVLLPNSLRVAAEAFAAGIPRRAGYARGGRGLLLTHPVPVPPRNPVRLHQRFYYLDLVTALGGPAEESFPSLREPKKENTSSDKRGVLAVCPGAEYGPAKRWPVESFVAAAKLLSEKRGLRVVLFGAPNDAPVAEQFLAQFPEAENLVGKTSLAEFMAGLTEAKLVLCNDSGAMHVAAALGRPTVAIFGSTEPQLTGPLGPRASVLRHHVPCSPCFLRECPIDFGCMKGITPEMVVEQAEKLLKLS
jgi:lipopolysaccharide heptosyltransferase II